jgi:hypothetical protein
MTAFWLDRVRAVRDTETIVAGVSVAGVVALDVGRLTGAAAARPAITRPAITGRGKALGRYQHPARPYRTLSPMSNRDGTLALIVRGTAERHHLSSLELIAYGRGASWE